MKDLDVEVDQLVECSGLDKKVVEAIVAGRYTTSPTHRQRLSNALGVSPDKIRWGQTVEVDHLYGHGPQFGRSP
jgi:plasmid maintenance system antidote protein VapI